MLVPFKPLLKILAQHLALDIRLLLTGNREYVNTTKHLASYWKPDSRYVHIPKVKHPLKLSTCSSLLTTLTGVSYPRFPVEEFKTFHHHQSLPLPPTPTLHLTLHTPSPSPGVPNPTHTPPPSHTFTHPFLHFLYTAVPWQTLAPDKNELGHLPVFKGLFESGILSLNWVSGNKTGI